MKKIGIILMGVIIVVAAVLMVARFLSGPEDGWICDEGHWIKHGNPSNAMPSDPCAGSGQQSTEEPRLIGGDKDAGGCLVGAGYSWCEAKQKCLRVWEENCDTTEQVSVEKSPDSLRVSSPSPGSLVKSPLVVSGEASGWYFESVFSVRVTDDQGNTLGSGQAQAQGDWMTTAFVPFSGSITFDPKGFQKGLVVFEKDNPSGLAKNALSYSVPIRFEGN